MLYIFPLLTLTTTFVFGYKSRCEIEIFSSEVKFTNNELGKLALDRR